MPDFGVFAFFGGIMEVLSPAGNRKALDAAIAAGADAIYLGYTAFSARSYAGNFDEKGLRDAVRAAHQFGRRVYVTVNTLVKENEMSELRNALRVIADAGADAILVQDAGVLRVARAEFPEMVVHASTQMTINNVQGVRLLAELGVRRVVPARECRLRELRAMADTGMEIEAFVHGALCVCVSGQCLFSGMVGGRSGNRGKCSQPCRLPYTLSDGTQGYLLSPRDLMLITEIDALRKAGIASLKIEGRMKSPEYVATVTDAYRRTVDSGQAPDKETLIALGQVFNRGGFTKGYIFSQNHAALMGWEKPNHWGVPAAKILRIAGNRVEARCEVDLEPGDVLQLRHGEAEEDILYAGDPVPSGKTVSFRAKAIPRGSAEGDLVWRLVSVRQNRLAQAFTPEARPRIALTGTLEAVPGSVPRLTFVTPDGRTGEAVGTRKVEVAGTAALTEAGLLQTLGKLRETPYTLTGVKLIGQQAYLPVGELNALRRQAVDALMKPRIESARVIQSVDLPEQRAGLIAVTETPGEAEMLRAAGADMVAWFPRDYRISMLEAALESTAERVIFILPTVTETQELQDIAAFVRAHSDRFLAVQVNNIGQINEAWNVPLTGGQGLNVMNSESSRLYTQLGLTRLTVSCELSAGEIRALKQAGGNYEIECYGRTQLMMLSHCPRRTRAGDRVTDGKCNACQADDGWCETLTDRKGMRFPLRRIRMADRCQISLYNSVVTDMAKRGQVLRSLGCMWRLMFTDETPEERRRITASYRQLLDTGRPEHEPDQVSTCGHLMRGVE